MHEEPGEVTKVRLELLREELKLIDAAIRQMDDITKNVKNWAIVTWTAALSASLASPELRPFAVGSAAVPFVFWFVDGSYRRVQRTFILRQRAIRDWVNGDDFPAVIRGEKPFEFKVLRMRKGTGDQGGTMRELWRLMTFKTVWLLYVGLIAVSIASWWLVNLYAPA